jgi:hypothetical protein
MKTLTINDLARSEQLDHCAMAAVRGGFNMSAPTYSPFKMTPSHSPAGDSSIHVTQDLQQYQNVINATANGSAFLSGVHANNDTSQFGQNNFVVKR